MEVVQAVHQVAEAVQVVHQVVEMVQDGAHRVVEAAHVTHLDAAVIITEDQDVSL